MQTYSLRQEHLLNGRQNSNYGLKPEGPTHVWVPVENGEAKHIERVTSTVERRINSYSSQDLLHGKGEEKGMLWGNGGQRDIKKHRVSWVCLIFEIGYQAVKIHVFRTREGIAGACVLIVIVHYFFLNLILYRYEHDRNHVRKIFVKASLNSV